MTGMPAVPAADETARRDEALSNACIDEYMHQPEVGPLEGAAPLDHPSAAQAGQWWPNPGEDPVASFGFHGDIHDIVERALRRAALWDEVKDRLPQNALALSGGQQQRLVIARALAIDPDILLMDEPASALDPISTSRIEDLMRELTPDVTIVIVTHNLQQARRVGDFTAFLTSEPEGDGALVGRLVEFGTTEKIFSRPADERTEAYVSGRFG